MDRTKRRISDKSGVWIGGLKPGIRFGGVSDLTEIDPITVQFMSDSSSLHSSTVSGAEVAAASRAVHSFFSEKLGYWNLTASSSSSLPSTRYRLCKLASGLPPERGHQIGFRDLRSAGECKKFQQ